MFGKWIEPNSGLTHELPDRAGTLPLWEDRVATQLSADTHFKGSLTFNQTLKIEGEFEGEINTSGTLLIGKNAQVKAGIRARSVCVEGTVTGNVTAEEKLHLKGTAKLMGDIRAGLLIVEEGALVSGHCEARPTAKMESETPSLSKGLDDEGYKIPIELTSNGA